MNCFRHPNANSTKCFGCVWLLGLRFDWRIVSIVLIGFVINFISTAIMMKRLQDSSMLLSSLGQSVLGILLLLNIIVAIQMPIGN